MIRCRLLLLAAVFASSACARAPAPDAVASSALPAVAAPASATPLALDAAPEAGAEASTTASSANASTADASLDGVDFIDQARILFRIAACGPTGDIPSRFDGAVVSRHCAELHRAYDEYKASWVDLAKPFLAALRPKDLPAAVVYPFGGGDLASALATFPDAAEITTISLEPAGDIRPVEKMPADHLAHELGVHRAHLERLFAKAHSRTENLEKESQTDMPGEIVFDLAALAIYGDEPSSLRYFRLHPDGGFAYVTDDDITAAAHHPVALHALFQNAELRFRSPDGQTRTLRHIAFNLDDQHLKADPSLLAHLTLKGKVAAMTKAASHLLWNDHFSSIRGWLIEHTDWMVSDSTGIPPRFAQPGGFAQETYGTFDGPAPFGLYDKRDADEFKRLFRSEPSRELSFRYGYPDQAGHAHLIVTRRVGNVADDNANPPPAGQAPPAAPR